MPRRGVDILDARGVRRPVPPPVGGGRAGPPGRRGRELMRARAALWGGPVRWWTRLAIVLVVGGMLGGLAFAGYAVATMGHPSGAPAAIAAACILAGWIVIGVATGARPDAGTSERVAADIARLRLCVCCGYDLGALPAGPDGCTVCPECGAAWRLGPGGRP